MQLPILTKSEAVDLVLLHTTRTVDHEDFAEEDMGEPVKTMMQKEAAITNCRLPYLLLKVAKKLNEDVKLWRIIVEKEQSDHLKGTHAHSKAKRKDYVVRIHKEKKSGRAAGFDDAVSSGQKTLSGAVGRSAGNNNNNKSGRASKN